MLTDAEKRLKAFSERIRHIRAKEEFEFVRQQRQDCGGLAYGITGNWPGSFLPDSVPDRAPIKPLPRHVQLANNQFEGNVKLLRQVLAKTGIKAFLGEHPTLNRTSVMDYKAGNLKGKVSGPKQTEIARAIHKSASSLNLIPHTDSDSFIRTSSD